MDMVRSEVAYILKQFQKALSGHVNLYKPGLKGAAADDWKELQCRYPTTLRVPACDVLSGRELRLSIEILRWAVVSFPEPRDPGL